MIRWHPPDCEKIAPPGPALALLRRAIAAAPGNAILHSRLADLHLDRYDFPAAAAALEAALRLDPDFAGARTRLARCHNFRQRFAEAREILAAAAGGEPDYERGVALAGLGLVAEAEAEFRAVLAADPHHRHACRKLCRSLRRAGRTAALRETCERLAGRGVRHAQLLLDWGVALALDGADEAARAILFDRARVAELALPVPDGFADIAAFNAALAEEILTNPYPLSDFPADEANRGSSRVHSLLAGRRPALIRLLLDSLQRIAAAYRAPPRGAFDPWAEARPAAAHLKAWGLIQRGGDHEDWHLHRGGWLSGVYYVRVPGSVSAEGAGGGCIEYGPPPALARLMPDFIPLWRHAPREGTLLLAPSHYSHRTIPTGADAHRISFAFDVVPER